MMWGLTIAAALAEPSLPDFSTVVVSADSFRMGCARGSERCWQYEKPRHGVTLTHDIEVMTTEVSQALYARVMQQKPWLEDDACIKWGATVDSSHQPATCLSWNEAVAFANALSTLSQLEVCYDITDDEVRWSNRACNGWRLPTEAEWEYAASGGKKQPFAGGSDSAAFAWSKENSAAHAQSVALLDANHFGLYDMSGNVWEWCWDWLAPYPNTALTDPTGPFMGIHKVRRGGSWYDSAQNARISERAGSELRYKSDHVGVRLVRFVEP